MVTIIKVMAEINIFIPIYSIIGVPEIGGRVFLFDRNSKDTPI